MPIFGTLVKKKLKSHPTILNLMYNKSFALNLVFALQEKTFLNVQNFFFYNLLEPIQEAFKSIYQLPDISLMIRLLLRKNIRKPKHENRGHKNRTFRFLVLNLPRYD
jgi:hypothetical protein